MSEKDLQINNDKLEPKNLRTYTSDMADVVRENEMSVIKIAVAEQKRHEMEAMYKKSQGSNLTKFLLLVGAIVLIIGGVLGAYYLLKKKEAIVAPTEIKKSIESFISFDKESFIDMTNATSSADVISAIRKEMSAGSVGSIHALFPTTSVSGTPALLPVQKFFSLMKSTAPGPLSRSLKDQYMIGTHTSIKDASKPHLFLIFQTNDFNVAYGGMLKWEDTLLDDLFGLFDINVSDSRAELFERPFKDIIIANIDARILYDSEGNEVLYYIFLDDDKIVITDNQETIKEILTRLITKKTKPL